LFELESIDEQNVEIKCVTKYCDISKILIVGVFVFLLIAGILSFYYHPKSLELKEGATIFTYPVSNPQNYGVVEFKNKKIKSITEKPKKTNSNLAITGIYLFDKNVINFSKQLKPSKRKELEIVDLVKKYFKRKKLKVEFIGRGNAWLDTGSIDSLYKASQFVASIESRQGLKIACLEEIALNNKWISKSTVQQQIKFYGKCNYSEYLKKIL
jgi:glucose-1-phosphate thymidylyltransferase